MRKRYVLICQEAIVHAFSIVQPYLAIPDEMPRHLRPFPTFIYNLAASLILLDARLAAVENQFHSATGTAVQLP